MQRRGRPRVGRCDRRSLRANLRQRQGNGKSFGFEGGAVGQARTTCGVDPLPDRAVYHGSVIRPCSGMVEATGHGRRSLLQPTNFGDFNGPGYCNRNTRVAVSTRGPETKGNPITAPGIGMRLERSDLAGLVGASAFEATGRSLAQLPLGS